MLRQLGEHRGRQELFRVRAPDVLMSMRQVALVESAESSNRIEGVSVPRPRIEQIVLKPSAPTNRSEEEIAAYRDALNLIHESARHMAFTSGVVLQLHAMLYRFQPGAGGRWKMAPNDIVERSADGTVHRVRFTPVSPTATPQAMEDLVNGYRGAVDAQRDALLLVPLAVLDFLCIHPFADGTGRTARLLTLLLLYHANVEVGRYVSLERVIEESKDTYYEALEASSQRWHDAAHDPHPWLRYFWGVLIAAYKEFEERVSTYRDARGAKTGLVELAVRRRTREFTIADIERESPGVSRDMVRHVLRDMKARGEIEVHGRGRGARWVRKVP